MSDVPSNDRLVEIADLGKEFVDTHTQIEFLEGRLAEAKKKYNRLSTEIIPYAMQSIGMTSFEIGNRYTIKTQPVLVVKTDKEKMQEIDSWLDQHGHGGMVKFKLEVFLPKNVDKVTIDELQGAIESFGFEYSLTKSIHYQTLNKWSREMDEAGEVIPMDLFDVYRGTKTVIVE
jgi:hypothetical protein